MLIDLQVEITYRHFNTVASPPLSSPSSSSGILIATKFMLLGYILLDLSGVKSLRIQPSYSYTYCFTLLFVHECISA